MNAPTVTTKITLPAFGGTEITVQDRGQGRPYLLLHGGAGHQSFALFAALLTQSAAVRVLTPVHPGFGGTPRPDTLTSVADLAVLYRDLLDVLDLTDVTVIGSSMGGWVTAELALLDSPRISSVVLVGASGIEVEGHPVADVTGMAPNEIMALSYHDPAPFRIDPSTQTDAQKAERAGNLAAMAVYCGATLADPTLLERLSAVTVPTLILSGESDGIVDVEYGRQYAAAIGSARFQVLPATGHMPQLETPELLLRAIQNAGGAQTGTFGA